jgi:CRP-like cAMP-binding protein
VGRGASIVFAGLKRHRAALLAAGGLKRVEGAAWFGDADQAIEHAERELLGSRDAPAEIPLERLALARGLDENELAALREALTRQSMRAGETLFREGESGDTLYLLAGGAVTIALASTTGSSRRLVTYAPGAMFGEMAMLDGRARSATALVVEDAVLYRLSRVDLDALAAASPGTAVKLLTNLACDLSTNLRRTTDTLRDLWDVRS